MSYDTTSPPVRVWDIGAPEPRPAAAPPPLQIAVAPLAGLGWALHAWTAR